MDSVDLENMLFVLVNGLPHVSSFHRLQACINRNNACLAVGNRRWLIDNKIDHRPDEGFIGVD